MNLNIDFNLGLKCNPYKGCYIVIEGIDGSGKSTQIEFLKNYLESESKGKKVILTSEPNKDLLIGKLIKDILKSKIKVLPKAYQYLYSADRVINHKTIVEKALQKGDTVISHRCFWSAIAYGVFDRKEFSYNHQNVDPLFVSQGIFSDFYQFIVPDLTFYLDINVNLAIQRLDLMEKKKEIYEKKEKLAKIVKGYQWLVKQFPKEFVVIDGSKSVEEVNKEIIQNLELDRRKYGL